MINRMLLILVAMMPICLGVAYSDEIILEDRFERREQDETKEQVGNGWTTNSQTRAKGNKQVDLDDGALHIYRHEAADHGVSVVQDLIFRNVSIEMRFRIEQGDELGINLADMKEKSVHAGHLCVAKIRPTKLSIIDLKTGRMNLAMRAKSQSKSLTKQDKQLLDKKQVTFPISLDTSTWHDLKLVIEGDTMSVTIDKKNVGSFTSPGIGHPTKNRLRLAVAKNAWVDDVIVQRMD